MLFGPLRYAFIFGSRCFYSLCMSSRMCECWLVKNTTSPVKLESKMRTEDGSKKSIFLKAFTLIPLLAFILRSVYVHHKDGIFLVASSHFKLSHVTHLVLLYCIHVFNVLFHPLNFRHHHRHHLLRSFLVLRSETNENAIFSLWNFLCCCVTVSVRFQRVCCKNFPREWKCQNRLKVHRGWLWGC